MAFMWKSGGFLSAERERGREGGREEREGGDV